MKANEFIIELKKESKPRNFVAKNAKMGGAGQHKDKKKAEKQGDVKHKKSLMPMESALSELSTEKLAQYKKASGADAKKADADGDYARGDKRFKGINRATSKQFDNDLKKHGQQSVAEGKVKLHTDPGYFGAEVDDTGFDSLPVVNIPANKLVGFEPDSKMNQPKSQANVEKIVAGLKKGDKLPPLLVRKYKDGYQVLDGHHRFWAYKLSGTKSIPVRIVADKDIEEIGKQGVAEGTGNDFRVGQQVIYTTGRGEKFPSIVTAVDFDEDAVKIKSANNKPFPNSGGDIEIVVDPGWKFLTAEPRVDPDSIIAVSPSMRKTTERVRDPEDWDEGNTEPPNNFAVYINGKKWKVFAGRGTYADDYREKAHYQQLRAWADKKSAATGKKWTVSITGEEPTV